MCFMLFFMHVILFIIIAFHIYSAGQPVDDPVDSYSFEHAPEISLWERLGKAAMVDIESSEFSWCSLSSLHHTEHSSTEHSEDEMYKAVEVQDTFCLYLVCWI